MPPKRDPGSPSISCSSRDSSDSLPAGNADENFPFDSTIMESELSPRALQTYALNVKEECSSPVSDTDLDEKDSERFMEMVPSAASASDPDDFPDGGLRAWSVVFVVFVKTTLATYARRWGYTGSWGLVDRLYPTLSTFHPRRIHQATIRYRPLSHSLRRRQYPNHRRNLSHPALQTILALRSGMIGLGGGLTFLSVLLHNASRSIHRRVIYYHQRRLLWNFPNFCFLSRRHPQRKLRIGHGRVWVIWRFFSVIEITTIVWPFCYTIASLSRRRAADGAFSALGQVPVAAMGGTEDLGRWLGTTGTVLGLGSLCGPPLGGLLTSTDLGYTAAGHLAHRVRRCLFTDTCTAKALSFNAHSLTIATPIAICSFWLRPTPTVTSAGIIVRHGYIPNSKTLQDTSRTHTAGIPFIPSAHRILDCHSNATPALQPIVRMSELSQPAILSRSPSLSLKRSRSESLETDGPPAKRHALSQSPEHDNLAAPSEEPLDATPHPNLPEAALDEGITEEPTSSETAPASNRLPVEVLQQIFDLALPPKELLNDSLHCGPNSAWCNAMVMKRALVSVSKKWYLAGTHFLYRNITIRRVTALKALLETLSADRQLGGFVRNISLTCYVPPTYRETVQADMSGILALCPDVKSFNVLAPLADAGLVPRPAIPSTTTSLKYGPYDMPDIAVLAACSGRLEELSLYASDASEVGALALSFPLLHTLDLTLCGGAVLETFAANWDAPQLKRLTLRVFDRQRLDRRDLAMSYEHILTLLGSTLEYLAFPPINFGLPRARNAVSF
ncbi:hypothetical protein DFH09DRAFT_1282852 [Mycena vulgaris]|nr:hypothetical protein DFH09DRAFT_1282852 [Mycena vulgaris]